MNEVEDLIKEIAVKHGIAVGRDDPIMILQTINNRLMQNGMKAQQEMLDQFKSELEEISQRWSIDTKTKAERILNASLDASKESMENLMQEGAKAIVMEMRQEMNTALSRVGKPLNSANKVAAMNLIAGGLTFLSVTALIWLVMHWP